MMKQRFKRAVVIVIDGLGVGALPDADRYNDAGSDTLDHVSKEVGGLKVENLSGLGLGLIEGVDLIEKTAAPGASFGRMDAASAGKDSSTGHWEIAGVIVKNPFATFPEGFPPELLEEFSLLTGYEWLWGRPASGTEIIERLGAEHLKTGKLIVYTSADSVFQIAAHEEAVPVTELYRVCGLAREMLDKYNIERVIARPFTGAPGGFTRTEGRKDLSMGPPSETLLDRLTKKGVPVIGIGKIGDLFNHRGIQREVHTRGDSDGMDKTIEAVKSTAGKECLIFTNLVDFDMLYGHRNNPEGCAGALERIDLWIPEVTKLLGKEDILVITGDHGCDPTTSSTDHSREYAPLLVYGAGVKGGVNLGTRKTFADLGATLSEAFCLGEPPAGTSFLSSIIK